MTSCVIYMRDSGGREQDLSISQQRDKITEYCATNGYIIVREFADVARSGTSTVGRAQFLTMLDYLALSPVPLVVYDLSRLSRDYQDAQYFLADLRRRGVEIHTVNDQVPEGLDGRLMESMIAWKNARYSEELGRLVRRGKLYTRDVLGAAHGIYPPQGFTFEYAEVGEVRGQVRQVRRLTPDPAVMPLVVKAFEMRADGATIREIDTQTRLHEWRGSYTKMFRRSVYRAIVGDDLWARVQAATDKAASRRGYHAPRAVRSVNWLTGLAYCALCGAPGEVHTSVYKRVGKLYRYYGCQRALDGPDLCAAKQVAKDALEAAVLDTLSVLLDDPQLIADLTAAAEELQAEQAGAASAETARITTQLAQVRARIARITAAIRDMGHSTALLADLRALEEEEARLASEMVVDRAAATVDPVSIPARISEALAAETPQEVAQVLRAFVDRVEFVRDKAHPAGVQVRIVLQGGFALEN